MIAAAACTPGVGRDPIFADAETIEDGGARDATNPPDAYVDAGLADSAVGLPDAEEMPMYPFTGVFGILNSQDALFAREVEGKLNLVVRAWPYEYVGTIAADGTVDTHSPEMLARGCAEATITGSYDRVNLYFVLEHRTCNEQNETRLSEIRGSFFDTFEQSHSGVYELSATVMAGFNCWTDLPSGHTVRYAINFIETSAVAVFTAVDMIPDPAFYRGTPGGDFAFSAVQTVEHPGFMPIETTIMGHFEQTTANDPLMFSGIRDVWDFTKGCGFTITLDGMRVSYP